ncbi:tail tubular protein A [Caudoviricetes sp.]|nr:tail tubular protein A [Caudoviricetes sp.]
MASINNLAATTELEAINAMLSAIGEAPIADVDTATQADAATAIGILRGTCREVQTQGWRFNTEFALAIAPSVEDFAWTEPNGDSLDIDIWLPPAGLISFSVTPLSGQIGSQFGGLMDLELRPSKQYTAGSPAAAVQVFYDRARNRDGFPASENRELLYIDPVWLFDFTQMPEVARRLVVIMATRRFVQSVLGEVTLVGFQQQDQNIALRALMREQGLRDQASMLDHPDVSRMFGGRPRMTGIFPSLRLR